MGEVCDEVVAWELSEVVKKCLHSPLVEGIP
jgi:hypothetical protein